MKSLVEFRSTVFPAYESERKEINTGRYGKRVAEYLQRRLPEFGVATGSVSPEDWGWAGRRMSRPTTRRWLKHSIGFFGPSRRFGDVRWWSKEEAGG